jgi:hypothetical protein
MEPSILIGIMNLMVAVGIPCLLGFIAWCIITRIDDDATMPRVIKTYGLAVILFLILSPFAIGYTGYKENFAEGKIIATATDKWTENGRYIIRIKETELMFHKAYASKDVYESIKLGEKVTFNYTTWGIRPFFYPGNKITSISK